MTSMENQESKITEDVKTCGNTEETGYCNKNINQSMKYSHDIIPIKKFEDINQNNIFKIGKTGYKI